MNSLSSGDNKVVVGRGKKQANKNNNNSFTRVRQR